MFRRRPQKRPINKEMLITVGAKEHRIAVVEHGVLEEFYIEDVASQRLAGNIYKARVDTILPGLGAAFVDIGGSKKGFLYLDEKGGFEDIETVAGGQRKRSSALTKGQEIVVQVVRESIGTKGPRLTRRVSLPGRFLVLVPYEHHIGISKRIESREERARIKQMLEKLRIPEGMGLIVRTEAEGMHLKNLARELKYLVNLWKRVLERARRSTAPSIIYEEYDLILRATRDLLTKEIDRILVDSREEYRRIANFVRSFLPQLRKRIRFYKGSIPLFERTGIEKQIEVIFSRKVPLKSGGSIVIEPTEALVAIDVNTGQFTGSSKGGKQDPERTAFVTNREAAGEIARQLRFKDLGGIIVIDFIDMKKNDYMKIVLDELREGVKRDKAKIKILQFSEIGLVEMTRQRIRKGVESTVYHTCPHCGGRGLLKG